MLEELNQKLKEKSEELKSVRAENKDQLEAINKLLQEHEENINKVRFTTLSVLDFNDKNCFIRVIENSFLIVQLEEEYESKRRNEIETLQEAVEEKESQIVQLHEQVRVVLVVLNLQIMLIVLLFSSLKYCVILGIQIVFI